VAARAPAQATAAHALQFGTGIPERCSITDPLPIDFRRELVVHLRSMPGLESAAGGHNPFAVFLKARSTATSSCPDPGGSEETTRCAKVDASAFNDRLTIATVETICTHALKI
jgi:hypothetical protein